MPKYEYKSIRIDKEFEEKLDKVRRRCNLGTAKELTELMIDFFERSGLDPRDTDTVSGSIKSLKDTLISFIRNQEKQILKPMQDELISCHEILRAEAKGETSKKGEVSDPDAGRKLEISEQRYVDLREAVDNLLAACKPSTLGNSYTIDKRAFKHFEIQVKEL